MFNYQRKILPNPKVTVDLIVKPMKLPTHSVTFFQEMDILPESIIWRDKALGKAHHAFIAKHQAVKDGKEGWYYVIRATTMLVKYLPPPSLEN